MESRASFGLASREGRDSTATLMREKRVEEESRVPRCPCVRQGARETGREREREEDVRRVCARRSLARSMRRHVSLSSADPLL